MRQLNQDCDLYKYKYNQANRMVIKKYMLLKSNKILTERNEVRNRTRKWIAMVLVVQACKLVDHRRKIIQEKHHRIQLEDKMARRL